MRQASAFLATLLLAHAMSAQFGQQGDKLVGAGAIAAAQQGSSVAVSADGTTLIVGGPGDAGGIGAAWVFTRSGGIWSQQGDKLVGTGAVGLARQGSAVAISGDGNTAIVGGPDDAQGTGAAWVFTRSEGVWSQHGAKLVGSDISGYPGQGSSVAISADGSTAIVGGPNDHDICGCVFGYTASVGAAWVYSRNGEEWSQQGKKLVGAGAAAAKQGSSVAISADGNTAIIGGPDDQVPVDADHTVPVGASWVFTRSGGIWSQQGGKLVGTGAVGFARQGSAVAISADGNTAIAGGPDDQILTTPDWSYSVGAAWVYSRSGGVWSQQGAKLVGSDADHASQGWSVALTGDGNTAIIGGPSDHGPWDSTGATWMFRRSAGVWSQHGGKLVGAETASGSRQGASVAVSADGRTAIVGGPGDDSGLGAVWVFSLPVFTAWVPVVAHNPGLNGSTWRSDLGLLNPGDVEAAVQLQFFGAPDVAAQTTSVPAHSQSILPDVVGGLGAEGQGALALSSDQPLLVTSRTYNQIAADAGCFPNGTQGQDYPAVSVGEGLAAGQAAYVSGLTEDAAYRSNIGLVDTAAAPATAVVELFDGAGGKLAEYTVALAAGQWAQEVQPFRSKAGQTEMERGYAKVTALSGAGVFAFASVVDNVTNDPTTVVGSRRGLRLVQEGSKLVGTGGVGSPSAGWSLAVSADGDTLIVGAPGDAGGVGAAWVFTRSAGAWSQQGPKLVGSGAIGAARQGGSVAISGDGNTAVVGGRADNLSAGAAWVFTRTDGAWSQQGPKLVGTGSAGSALQGTSVAVSAGGDTVLVGGAGDDGWNGASWVFTRSGGVWSQDGPKLVGSGAVGAAQQGSSLAISGDGRTVIVGGPYDGDADGAAWVFTRAGWMWSQEGPKLVGSGNDGKAQQGTSVGIAADGATAVIGGPWDAGLGAAWIFTRTGGVWSQQGDKLVGSGAVVYGGQGSSAAISADGTAVILGGPYRLADTCPSFLVCRSLGEGAAWVFTRAGGVWSEAAKLVGTGAVGDAGQGAGVAVSADGTTALVGGPGDAAGGAAWVFSAPPLDVWVPVAAHNPGLHQSEWRSDLGLLNPGAFSANVQLRFFGSSGTANNTTYVPAGAQSILTDVVGQLGAAGQGALEISSDRPLTLTSRTYNQIAAEAGCYPNGTQGQDYPVFAVGDGLAAGQSAYLPALVENAAYRCNIGLVNAGPDPATALVELFDGAGTKLAEYAVPLAPGQWAQEIQPFRSKAAQTAMDRGYARITVQSGSGVFGSASVVDNVTNDATTVAMLR
jgi:hypothetical protein